MNSEHQRVSIGLTGPNRIRDADRLCRGVAGSPMTCGTRTRSKGSQCSSSWPTKAAAFERKASSASPVSGQAPSTKHAFNAWYPSRRLSGRARESGYPDAVSTVPAVLDPRFRGGDENEQAGVICRVRTPLMSAFPSSRRVNLWLPWKLLVQALPGKAGGTVVMTTVDQTLMRGSKPHDR
jgi:hypothetical protein